jgi:hypothetical protein
MIRMKMSDGADIAVYQAEAVGERRGGLVLVQEIFGVTDHIRELCDEYAADGYDVLSPAIFDREHPGFEADYTGPDYNRAVELAQVCAAELKALAETGPTAAELSRAKAVLNAGLWMSDESPAARAGRAAAQVLIFGALIPSQTMSERTLAQTVDTVRSAAATSLMAGLCATAVLGPKAAAPAGAAFREALFG